MVETVAPAEEAPKYKSKFAQQYEDGPSLDVTPQEEAIILGEKKALKKTYGTIIDDLKAFEEKIKNIGLKNKSPVALFVYQTLDKIGLYKKEHLIEREIRKLDDVQDRLDKKIREYSKTTEKAHGSARDSETIKYKAQILKHKYTGMLEDFVNEKKNLATDAKALAEEIKNGNDSPRQREKFIALKKELSDMDYDLRKIKKKRNKSAAAVVKSHGKTSVYRANELFRGKILTALEAKSDKIDVLRSQLEDLKELSKDRGLIAAIQLLQYAEGQGETGEVMVEELGKEMEQLYETLNDAELDETLPPVPNVGKLEAMDMESQNAMNMRADEIEEKDLEGFIAA